MKILHVQKVAGVGGSERHLLGLLPALEAQGHEAVMVGLTVPGSEDFRDAVLDAGITYLELPFSHSPSLVMALRRVARDAAPDLVHTHLVHADVLGQSLARAMRLPSVSSVHATGAHYRRAHGYAAAFVAGRLADRVIAISDHVKRFVVARRFTAPDSVEVVKYGIDLDAWEMDLDSRARLRSALRIGAHEVVVLVASRLVANKGHDFLLEAFAAAALQGMHARLVVAGDGPLRSDLERRAAELGLEGTVEFLGYRPDVRELMCASDVVAFPTMPGFGEGFGMVNLEAAALGLPLVGTAIDSVPEIVDDGRTGFLVAPGDVAGLATVLERLAADGELRAEIGRAARARAERLFTLDRMVDETLAVYERVLESRGRSAGSPSPRTP